MLIDTHCHVIPPDLPRQASDQGAAMWPRFEAAPGGERLLVSGASRLAAKAVYTSTDARLSAMEADGVDVEVISPMPFFLSYAFAAEDGLRLSRHVNDFVLRLCMEEPRRFYGLGIVPMQDPDLAARELSNIRECGLSGVEIVSNVNGLSLGDSQFLGFFQEAERLGLAIFVHGLNPVLAERLGPAVTASFGIAEDIGVAAIALLSNGVLEKCPNIRISLSHGGGGFALMLPRAQYFWSGAWNEGPRTEAALGGGYQLPLSPSEYARRFYYDTLVFDRRAIRYLADVMGTRRLLVGTDHPSMIRERPVGFSLRSTGFLESEVQDMTWNNALAFLGVDGQRS